MGAFQVPGPAPATKTTDRKSRPEKRKPHKASKRNSSSSRKSTKSDGSDRESLLRELKRVRKLKRERERFGEDIVSFNKPVKSLRKKSSRRRKHTEYNSVDQASIVAVAGS